MQTLRSLDNSIWGENKQSIKGDDISNELKEISKNKDYDIVLVDTSHILDEINLTVLDYSYMSLFIVTNDLFRDYLENITDNRKRETERIWIIIQTNKRKTWYAFEWWR